MRFLVVEAHQIKWNRRLPSTIVRTAGHERTARKTRILCQALAAGAAALLAAGTALAQAPGAPPPAVGVAKVERQPITVANEFVGRVQATDRVNLVARVTAFLDKRLFNEGAEVKKGDLLYLLEQGPFQADVQAKQAAIAQIQAQLQNANLTLGRQKALLTSPAGQQSAVDLALSNQQALQAQLLAAQAQLEQSKINLAYTEIRAPIDGKIGRTAVTVGNVVTPNSGVLATIVSQDPMYLIFPVSARVALELRDRYAARGSFSGAVVKLRLPNGKIYGQAGRLDFFDNSVAGTTDTITMRGVVPNPAAGGSAKEATTRELVDDELVTVILEDAEPTSALTVPRAAVLTDQSGDFVYLVDDKNVAQQRRIKLGQATAGSVAVLSGLEEGATIIVDGVQRVRAGAPVTPGAPNAPPAAAAAQAAGGGGGASR
jgi:membrane fusion protein (multidrug efflux system)